MFLEAQFGADNVSPIAKPALPLSTIPSPTSIITTTSTAKEESTETAEAEKAALEFTPAEKAELNRLHGLGIPVPGIEIRVDKVVARVWLEELRVECAQSAVLRDRVGRVVGRAVECLSGLV